MSRFYEEVIAHLLETKVLDKQMKLLVVCGWSRDKEVLAHCEFEHVVISNLDSRTKGDEFSPFEWSFQDAENLTLKDESFDFCIVHAGLHHCYSPHRALLEMYRVSKKGILLLEPYDNLLTQLGVRFKFGQSYEHAAVFYNDCAYGGVANSDIPNYIYRWTEKEIIKTINTFAPYGQHQFHFIHQLLIPWNQLKARRNKLFFYLILLIYPLIKVINLAFPKLSNNFAAVVLKPELPRDLHPWLLLEGETPKPNLKWLHQVYKKI